MCESNVYIKKEDQEELVMQNVAAIKPLGDGRFLLQGLLGESCEIQGKLEDINLMAHKIVFS